MIFKRYSWPIHAWHNINLSGVWKQPINWLAVNFIQGWRARDLNNKWEIATSLSSLFYFILFYVHFLLPVIYLEILNARIRWWTGSLLTAFRMASQHADYYDFKKNSDFPPQVSDTLIGIGYLCLLSKHKLKWDCTTYGKQNNHKQ